MIAHFEIPWPNRTLLRWLLFCNFWVVPALGAPPERETGQGDSPSEIRYRELRVPADDVAPLATGYLPLARKRFAEIIATPAVGASDSASRFGPRWEECEYRARLDGDFLVDGVARCKVRLSAEKPALLSLGEFNLAIASPIWNEDPPVEAMVGLSGNSASVWAERSGEFKFGWSLKSKSSAGNEKSFSAQLIPSIVTQFILELPADTRPSAEGGIVEPFREAGEPNAVVSPQPAGKVALTTKLWRIRLSGSRLELSIHPVGETVAIAPPRVRMHSRHLISETGGSFQARWELADGVWPLVLPLELDRGLEITTAQMGDQVLNIRELGDRPSGNGKESGRRWEIEIPRRLSTRSASLNLSGVSLPHNRANWQLPRVRSAVVVWQDGTAVVEIAEPLTIRGIRPRNSQVTRVDRRASSSAGERIEFQDLAPDASVEFDLGLFVAKASIASGVSIEWNAGLQRAKQIIQYTMIEGKQHRIEALAWRDWIIDGVEIEPVGLLDEWRVESQARKEAISLSLRRSVSAGDSMHISIRAHRRIASVNSAFPVDQLRLAEFPGAHVEQSLVALRAEPPLRVLPGKGLFADVVDSNALPPAQLGLLDVSEKSLVIHDTGDANQFVELHSEKPRFATQVSVGAAKIDGRLHETFRVRCVPESGQIERLKVVVSEAIDTPIVWRLATDSDSEKGGELRTQLVPAETTGQRALADVQVWEIALPHPIEEPFEVVGSRRRDFTEPMKMGLVSAPDAQRQQGMLRLNSESESTLQVIAPHFEPCLDAATRSSSHGGAVLFTFDPSRALYETAPSLVATPPLLHDALDCRAWRVFHQVFLANPGVSVGTSTFYLENRGRRAITARIPRGARLQWLRQGDETVPIANDRPDPEIIEIPLDASQRYVVLSLEYQLANVALPWIGRLGVATPEVNVPVMRSWLGVHLPSAWCNLSSQKATPTRFSLLGGIVAPCGDRWFNPFRLRSWQEAFSTTNEAESFQAEGSRDLREAALSDEPWFINPLGESIPHPFAQTNESARATAHVPSGVWPTSRSRQLETGQPAFTCELQPGQNVELFVASRPGWRLLGWTLMALAALVVTVGKARPPLLVAIASISILFLLMPWPYFIPLGEGGLIGSVLGVLFLRCRVEPREPRRTAAGDPVSVSTLVAPVANCLGWVLVLIVGMSGLDVQASDETAKPQAVPGKTVAGKGPLFTILNPTDEKGKPQGDYLFVPREFYDVLHRRIQEPRLIPVPYRIGSAEYHASLSRVNDAGFQGGEVSILLNIQTAVDQASVLLPFQSNEVFLPLDRVLIDGREVRPVWNAEGNGLTLPVAQAGLHRCELIAVPRGGATQAKGKISFSIPRSLNARLTLHTPLDSPEVQIPEARGAVRRGAGNDKWIAELGPVDRLEFRWETAPPKSQLSRDSKGVQAYWLRFRPGSVVVQTRFRFLKPSGNLDQIRIPADPQLRVMALPAGTPYSVKTEVEQGQRYFVVYPKVPVTADLRFELSFSVLGASGVGNYSLPLPVVEQIPQAPRWLTVSADPSLHVMQGIPNAKDAVAKFREAWGAAGEISGGVAALKPDDQSWRVNVQLRLPQQKASQSQTVRINRREASIEYSAEVEVSQGSVFEHRFKAPPRAEIVRIAVNHEGLSLPVRWAVGNDSVVSVFLPSALGGKQKITASLKTPLDPRPQTDVPLFLLQGVKPVNLALTLERSAGVSAKVIQSWGLEAVPGKTIDRRSLERGISFAELQTPAANANPGGDATEPRVRVEIRPNSPKVSYSQLTQLGVEKGEWIGSVVLAGSIAEGDIDELHFEWPVAWRKELRCMPSGEFRFQEPAGGSTSRVTLIPEAPLRGEFQVVIHCRAQANGEGPLSAPLVKWLDFPAADFLYYLPERDIQRSIEWSTVGMRRVDSPPAIATELNDPSSGSLFRVMAPEFRAEVRAVERAKRSPSARLCDVFVQMHDEQRAQGIAQWSLDPAGDESCLLFVPTQVNVVEVCLGDVPALATIEPNGLIRVKLQSRRLSQSLRVVFTTTLEKSGDSIKVRAPHLAGWPTQRVLWSVANGRGSSPPELSNTQAAISKLDSERERLQAIADMIEQAREQFAEHSVAELASWKAPWSNEVDEIDARISNPRAPIGNDPFEAAKAAVLVDSLKKRLADSKAAESNDQPHQVAYRPSAAAILRSEILTRQDIMVAAIDDVLGEIELNQPHTPNSASPFARLAAAAAVALVPLLFLWPAWRAKYRGWWQRWPYLGVTLVGLLAWIMLSPSWLGLVVALGAVVGSIWDWGCVWLGRDTASAAR